MTPAAEPASETPTAASEPAPANVICIKWGTLFGPEYVNRLYSGVRRNLTAPVRFFCMTEHAEGLHPDINVLPLPDEPFRADMDAALAVANRQGAMRKVSLFRPDLIPDLRGPVEARRGRKTGHGSVFRYDPAAHGWLYDTLAADPTGAVERARGSEQRYTSTLAQDKGAFAYLPGDQVVSFKHGCLRLPPMNWLKPPRLPDNARVVCFHGRPKMTEAVDGFDGGLFRHTEPCAWLRDHWITRAQADLGPEWG